MPANKNLNLDVNSNLDLNLNDDENDSACDDDNDCDDNCSASGDDSKNDVGKHVKRIVNSEYANMRLDVFITQVFPEIPSRSFVAKWIQDEKVTVDGRVQKPSLKLVSGQVVVVDTSFLDVNSSTPVGEKIPLSIVYEDKHILVVDKPAGMVVHPGAGVRSGTLVNAIIAHCGAILPSLGTAQRAGIVHRLDKETSGLLVVAKTQLALSQIAKQFSAHTQTRVYLALVYGIPKSSTKVIETWHGRDPKKRIHFAVQKEGVGKRAIMSYVVKEEFYKKKCALLECRLKTGRTHQIRVQLESIGNPIIGDKLYGLNVAKQVNDQGLKKSITANVTRHLLHACRLDFTHPESRLPLSFSSPLPDDFNHFLNELRRENEE